MRISGTINWAKLDKPRPNYNKERKIMEDGEPAGWNDEYSVVIGNLTRETKLALKEAGLIDKVKNKMNDQEDHITFRLPVTKKDGTENDPIKVTNAATGLPWDWKEDGLIGNGSKGVIAFNIWKGGAGKASIFPVSLLVTEHVEYESEGGGDYEDPDDWSEYLKPAAGAKAKAPASSKKAPVGDDLDDDVPF